MTDLDVRMEALLAEEGWLERLALHLTRDPARARDLVQSTFVAALESGDGGEVRRPRAWLGAVARRIASSWRRRDHRAADAASSNAVDSLDPAPAADEVVERLELQRLVAEALLDLDEPFRSTLHGLYFRGERPEAMARRTGVAAGTVRWRAFRGRELLRGALARRSGRTWDALALQLAPIGGALQSAAAEAAPALLVPMTIKSAAVGLAAGAILALASDAAWPSRNTAPDTRTAGAPRPSDGRWVGGGEELADVPKTETPRRAPTPAAVPDGVRLARGWVRSTPSGAPVSGASLRFTRGAEDRVAVIAGDAWAIEGLAPGDWTAEVTRDGFAPLVVEVTVPEDALIERSFELTPTGVFAVRVLDAAARPLPRALDAPIPLEGLLSVAVLDAAGDEAGRWRGRTWRDPLPSIPADAVGEVVLAAPPPVTLELRYGTATVDAMELQRVDQVVDWRVALDSLRGAERALRFRVVDDAGDPLDAFGVLRPLFREGVEDGRIGSVSVGEFLLPPGGYRLELRAPGRDRLVREVTIRSEAVDLGDLVLAREGSDR